MVQSMKTVENVPLRDRCQTSKLATVAVFQWWRKLKRRSPTPGPMPSTGVVGVGGLIYSLFWANLAARDTARFIQPEVQSGPYQELRIFFTVHTEADNDFC